MNKKLIYTALLLLFSLNITAQSLIYENKTFKKGIETVLIYKEGWQLSFPIIDMNKPEEKITLSFDELGNQTGDYSWTVKYCNMNWTESELDPIDYIDGFAEGYVSDYALSKNTKVNYINYQVRFPNDDMSFRKSGNYVVIVFENNDPEQIVLTQRFYVINPETVVKGDVFKQSVARIEQNQTVNFSIKFSQDIINAAENLKCFIVKNGEAQLNAEGISPSRFTMNEMAYEHISELSFSGVNEYRHFDIKSVKFLSDKLQNVENSDKYYKVLLRPDEILSGEPYNYKPDINGRRLIKLENIDQSNIEADYAMVTFRLAAPLNINSGDYYVYGALSNWKISDKFKMHYDERGFYTTTVFLKQGYYNYRYIFKSAGLNIADDARWYIAEGNFYQTENDYYVLCYYKNPIEMCDELVGFVRLNTEKK